HRAERHHPLTRAGRGARGGIVGVRRRSGGNDPHQTGLVRARRVRRRAAGSTRRRRRWWAWVRGGAPAGSLLGHGREGLGLVQFRRWQDHRGVWQLETGERVGIRGPVPPSTVPRGHRGTCPKRMVLLPPYAGTVTSCSITTW